jgi:hypothetical protein
MIWEAQKHMDPDADPEPQNWYFGHYTEMIWKKYCYLYIWLKWIQILIGRPWMSMPIQIRKNDADASGSGSTTHW